MVHAGTSPRERAERRPTRPGRGKAHGSIAAHASTENGARHGRLAAGTKPRSRDERRPRRVGWNVGDCNLISARFVPRRKISRWTTRRKRQVGPAHGNVVATRASGSTLRRAQPHERCCNGSSQAATRPEDSAGSGTSLAKTLRCMTRRRAGIRERHTRKRAVRGAPMGTENRKDDSRPHMGGRRQTSKRDRPGYGWPPRDSATQPESAVGDQTS